jgi:hypothetical protein
MGDEWRGDGRGVEVKGVRRGEGVSALSTSNWYLGFFLSP